VLHNLGEFAWTKACRKATQTAAFQTQTHSSNDKGRTTRSMDRQQHFSRGLYAGREKI